MAKIITVTLNPAIDRVVELKRNRTDGKASEVSSYSYPAGKGINVSRALACLGIPSTALGVVGEEDAEFFDTAGNELITTEWVTTKTRTRTNITTYDITDGTERHERMAVETNEEFPTKQITQMLEKYCGADDIVIFSGSIPANAPVRILYNLCTVCQDKGAKVVIDSSGEVMARALKAHPYAIKGNLEEFEELTGETADTDTELMHGIGRLYDRCYSRVIIVSRGKDGAMMYDRDTDLMYKGSIELDEEGMTLHSVGSGDAMTAGFCAALLRQPRKPMEQLRLGLAAGTANLFTRIPGQIDEAKTKELSAKARLYRN